MPLDKQRRITFTCCKPKLKKGRFELIKPLPGCLSETINNLVHLVDKRLVWIFKTLGLQHLNCLFQKTIKESNIDIQLK